MVGLPARFLWYDLLMSQQSIEIRGLFGRRKLRLVNEIFHNFHSVSFYEHYIEQTNDKHDYLSMQPVVKYHILGPSTLSLRCGIMEEKERRRWPS